MQAWLFRRPDRYRPYAAGILNLVYMYTKFTAVVASHRAGGARRRGGRGAGGA
eukprot:SAG31_NODE_28160_length_414_cov_1.485714_1_plen_52_part_01